ncbi:hypothetical protein ACHAXS_006505 [Conticribra weissflogii]
MPSPSRTYFRRQDQDHGLDLGLEDSNSRDVYSGNDGNSDGDGGNDDDANRTKSNRNSNPLQAKRPGPFLPPRGQIPLESNGFESVEAFWKAARSPPAGTSDNEHPSRAKKERERQRLLEERRKQLEELEREARDNAARGPEILIRNEAEEDDDDDEDDGATKPRQQRQQQRTPNPPGWTNRLLHKAMGIPTGHNDDDDDDDRGSVPSPAYTVLSRVSTAPPSAAASIATHATEASARHALRQQQEQLQLDNLVRERVEKSPSARSAAASPSANSNGMRRSPPPARSPSSSRDSRDKGLDPPEEMDASSNNSRSRGGVAPDPVEKDLVLEPPEQDGEREERQEVDFTSSGNDGFENNDDDMELNSRASSKVSGKSGTESRGKLSERTTPSKELDESLEQVVESFDKEYYRGNRVGADDDDDDKESGGGMQLATQEDMDDNPQFDAGGGDHDYDDGMDAQTSNREDKSEADTRSRQSSKKSKSSKAAESTYSSDEEEENTPPKRRKFKRESAPVTPSALRKKGSKKKNVNQRVNWSTPTGRATGIPAANRDYEAVPVSDYKEDYPPGKEPQTPGGTQLRRSKRARFKPLQFWKNEKLIYEAQHEEGLLGEAMGDMPVVTGVMHALPTPYKERKVRDRPANAAKREKKRKRTSEDGDSDDGQSASKATPFDDSKLRKRYHIHDGESGSIWSEPTADVMESKVVSRMENRSFSKLPLSSMRKKTESKVVGFASQAFHILTDENDHFPGYIAGNVVLPPRGIKDAEGVGLCSQVFNVGDCQPNSLELALADPSTNDGEFDHATAQRYLLSKGDMFHVPPGNVYRIENHSKTEKASLFWTIVKCTNRAEQESDED